MAKLNTKIVMLEGEQGKDGTSIKSVEKSASDGLTDTYTITLTDGSKSSFNVTNGKGIKSISKTGAIGLDDIYTITYNDETTSTFTVPNGKATELIQSQIVPTASIEKGETASNAYLEGDFLVKGGILYKVTNAISKDDALTVGTNIAMTTVGGELSGNSNLMNRGNKKLDDSSYLGSTAYDYFRLVKIGNVVFANFRKSENTSPRGKITIKKLPTEFIPKNTQRFSLSIHNHSNIPFGIVKNDGYLYTETGDSISEIHSEFFYFLD